MAATKESARWHPPLLQFVSLVLLLVVVIALANFAKTMVDNYRLRAEKEVWQAKIDEEEARYARLQEQKTMVESDSYQRKLAHEMGLYAPDEQPLVLVLPPDQEDDGRAFEPLVREREVLEPPYWQQWWELFFGSDE